MRVPQWIILSILMLVLMVTYNPSARAGISQSWKDVQPVVLVFMDGVYAMIRDFVAGSGAEDGIDDNAPGVDFDHVITMERGDIIERMPEVKRCVPI